VAKLSKFVIALIAVSVAIMTLPSQSSKALEYQTDVLPLPPLKKSINEVTEASQDEPLNWRDHKLTVQKNDSLSTLLNRVNVSAKTTYKISRLKNSKRLTNLKVGDELTVWVDKNDQLKKILYPQSKSLSYELVKTDLGYRIDEKKQPIEIRTETGFATIEGSFYPAAKRAGLSARSIMNLADLFSWDIDFLRELRKGDTLKVIYETQYMNGEYIGDGDIVAAQITTHKGKHLHNAFLLRNKTETVGYFNEKGKNLKKAFLKNPVDYVRITSKFNPRRFHPIKKIWKAHRGVDYGGPLNTPIRATGNGKIVARGWSNGYGRYIKVRHAGKYLTVYGHLNKHGKYKKGQYVKQGAVIGYMGKTGLATGVHLHYEFRINGKHVDPLKMKFPAKGPVPKKYKDEFKLKSTFLMTQLERIDNQTSQIARSFE